jgi:tripartite ATP-independent transporter DctM subunit
MAAEVYPVEAVPIASSESDDAARGWLGAIDAALMRTLTFIGVVLLLTMFASTTAGVISRYVFNAAFGWTDGLSVWCFVWLVFVGAIVGVRQHRHVSIDMVAAVVPRRFRPVLEGVVDAFVAWVCLLLLANGGELAAGATQKFSATVPWPQWLYYGVVPFSALITLLVIASRRTDGRYGQWRGLASVAGGAGLFGVYLAFGDLTAPSVISPTLLMTIVFALMLLAEVPVSFAMLGGAFVATQTHDLLPGPAVVQIMLSGVDGFLLLAIPFFMASAYIMNEGGITRQLMNVAIAFVGHFRGGLAQVVVLVNLLMGGLSGSSSGDAAATAKMMVPQMLERGYAPGFSGAIVASSSILANIVPPAIAMLLYAQLANVSVPQLFLAGYLPGVLLAGTLMVWVYIAARRNGYGAASTRASRRDVWAALRGASWALGMPVIIIGGMRLGVVTPTEASALAVAYALLVMVVLTGFKPSKFYKLLSEVVADVGSIGLLVAASAPFAWIMIAERIPARFAEAMLGLTHEPILILLMINLVLFVLGMPLEPPPAMLITIPIFSPLLRQLGIDPVHFGIVVITNLMIGTLTPPVGSLVFIVGTVTRIRPSAIFKAAVPMTLCLLVGVLLLTYIPWISLVIPSLFSGR